MDFKKEKHISLGHTVLLMAAKPYINRCQVPKNIQVDAIMVYLIVFKVDITYRSFTDIFLKK